MTTIVDQADALLLSGNVADAVSLIEAAAQRGDAAALRQLGEWRLIGHPLPRDLPLARALFREARERGDIAAARTEIALTANGTGAAPDWPAAVELLTSLADRDAQSAQDLALLAAMELDEHGMPTHMAKLEALSRRPNIWHCRGFLSPQECAHIAQSVAELLEPSVVADPQTGRNIQHPIRTSSAAIIGPTRETLPIQAVQQRIAAVSGTQVAQGEPFVVLHYAPGQQYRRHLDTLPNEPNQRIKTAILYLNEGYDGGATHFPACDLSVSARGGDLIIFDNVTADGAVDPVSVHAGLPVEQGAKWVATRWIRACPLDIWVRR